MATRKRTPRPRKPFEGKNPPDAHQARLAARKGGQMPYTERFVARVQEATRKTLSGMIRPGWRA
jgi:hypothetical protein